MNSCTMGEIRGGRKSAQKAEDLVKKYEEEVVIEDEEVSTTSPPTKKPRKKSQAFGVPKSAALKLKWVTHNYLGIPVLCISYFITPSSLLDLDQQRVVEPSLAAPCSLLPAPGLYDHTQTDRHIGSIRTQPSRLCCTCLARFDLESGSLPWEIGYFTSGQSAPNIPTRNPTTVTVASEVRRAEFGPPHAACYHTAKKICSSAQSSRLRNW